MSGEITLPIVGNLTDNPIRCTTQNGRPYVTFTIASSSRVRNQKTGQYENGNTVFMRCTAWAELAEHILATCTKGMRVVAYGELRQHSYKDDASKNHTLTDMNIIDMGPSLRYATAQVNRIQNNNGYGNGYAQPRQGGQQGGYTPQTGYQQPPQFNDPYDPANQFNTPTPQPQAQQPGFQSTNPDEPEF